MRRVLCVSDVRQGDLVTVRVSALYTDPETMFPSGVASRDIRRGEMVSFDPDGNTEDILRCGGGLMDEKRRKQ